VKRNKIIAIIVMITGVLFVIGGYASLTVNNVCPCATTSEPCYCGTTENPIARVIIFLGIPIAISGAIFFIGLGRKVS
jgi:hypothetical protein